MHCLLSVLTECLAVPAERDDLLDQLNDDFEDISALLEANKRPTKVKEKRPPRDPDAEHPTAEKRKRDMVPDEPQEGEEEFDRLARELQSEMRAHAVERLKTPEEIAKEEHERLVRPLYASTVASTAAS